MKEAQINRLVAQNPNQIAAPALRAAVVELQARQQKEQTERAIEQLAHAENILDAAVNDLRAFRKAEAKAKAYLVAVNAAKEAFHANGDYAAFEKAVYAAQVAKMGR